MRTLLWHDTLQQAHAQGAERLIVLDAESIDGVHADVDVTLRLAAAKLNALDALAPLLRHDSLVDRSKTYLQQRALHAMAEKDTEDK